MGHQADDQPVLVDNQSAEFNAFDFERNYLPTVLLFSDGGEVATGSSFGHQQNMIQRAPQLLSIFDFGSNRDTAKAEVEALTAVEVERRDVSQRVEQVCFRIEADDLRSGLDSLFNLLGELRWTQLRCITNDLQQVIVEFRKAEAAGGEGRRVCR